ncbi:MAG: NAD(P)-dependent oxidoreductase [Burkholderiaceae bacterium]
MNDESRTRDPIGEGASIGLIGLGAMGRGTAGRLLAAGYQVIGSDLDAGALSWLASQGGTPAQSAADLTPCDAVILFVVNDRQTEAALYGENGAVAHLRRGTVVVTCSTMPPAYVQNLGPRLAADGLRHVDSPVTGGRLGARNGTMTLMVGADPADLARVRPVLERIGGRIYHLGDAPGAGAQMKVINQLMCGVHIAAAGEALALARRLGLPLDVTHEILCSGAAGSWMLGDRGPRMVNGDWDDVASAVDIFVKDLGLVLEAAEASGHDADLARTAHARFVAASEAGLGGKDDSAVMLTYLDDTADDGG